MLINKNKFLLLILSINLGSFSLAQAETCNSQFNTCGVEFTTIPNVSNLTLATCTNPIVETYTIKNFLPFSVSLGVPTLIQEDDLSYNAVTIHATTCTASLAAEATCDIDLEFALCEIGTVQRELKIPVMTSQGYVSTPITIDVIPPTISFAYITNQTDVGIQAGNVSICNVRNDGELTSCQNTGESFNSPAGITIPAMILSSAYTYAYIVNTADDSISLCTIDNVTGFFTHCNDAGPGNMFMNPFGITSTIGIDNNNYYVYITEDTTTLSTGVNTNVKQCVINPTTGELNHCRNTLTLPTTPGKNGITTQTINNTDYTYVTNSTAGTITVCVNNPMGGDLQNCFDSGVNALFTEPWNIAFYTTENNLYAYIADINYQSHGAIWQCTVNLIHGGLSDCTTHTLFETPSDIDFFNIVNEPYAWVTNKNANALMMCKVDPVSGGLNCPNSYTSLDSIQQHNEASGITSQKFANVDYIYVVLTNSNDIQQCKVSPTSLLYCISALENLSNNPFTRPNNIVFNLNSDGNVYAYVTDTEAAQIFYCAINQTSGQFTNCQPTGPEGFNAPLDLTFASMNGMTYTYIADTNYETVFQCEVQQPQNHPTYPIGSLCHCTDAAININAPYTHPVAVTSANFNVPYVYVADAQHNLIYQCELNNDTGLFSACVIAGSDSSFFNNPTAIDFAKVETTTYAYITNNGNDTITQCSVNSVTGQFSSVCQINAANATPNRITSTQMQSHLYAYLTFPHADSTPNLQRCMITSNGSLTDCQNAFGYPTSITLIDQVSGSATATALVTEVGGSGVLACSITTDTYPWHMGACTDAGTDFLFSAPQTLVVQSLDNSTYYAYIVDSEQQTVTQCTVTTEATLDNCQESGAGALAFNPTSISFTRIEDDMYAYINDSENLYTTQCLVSAENGQFSDCVTMGLPILTQPLAISFYEYAYLPDAATGSLAVCKPQEEGLLQFCKDSGVGPYFTQPVAVALNINLENELLAYVADISTNTVVVCRVDQITGLFSSCEDSGVGAIFNQPAGITFNSLTGTTYAYITNSGSNASYANSVYQCTLNSDGTFANCINAAEMGNFSKPINIQFLTAQ